jgi:hypothetical protein
VNGVERYDFGVAAASDGELRIASVAELLKAVELGVVEKGEARRLLGLQPRRGRWSGLQPREGGRFAKSGTYPLETFTAEAQTTLWLAQDQARRHGRRHLATEDLLIALLEQPDLPGGRLLRSLPVDEPQIREALAQADRDEARLGKRRPLSRARRVIDIAVREGAAANREQVGSEHLLLGLVIDEGVAGRALRMLGVTEEGVRERMREGL